MRSCLSTVGYYGNPERIGIYKSTQGSLTHSVDSVTQTFGKFLRASNSCEETP